MLHDLALVLEDGLTPTGEDALQEHHIPRGAGGQLRRRLGPRLEPRLGLRIGLRLGLGGLGAWA